MAEILWEPCGRCVTWAEGWDAVLVCRLLGPVEVEIDGAPIDIGHPRRRCVLAALLVDANAVVSLATLVGRVWGENPPSSARNTLYAHIARLRKAFEDVAGLSIARRSGGYVAIVEPSFVDLHRFRALRNAARNSDDDGAAGQLDEALSLWRDTALSDVTGSWAETLRTALDDERTNANLERNAVLLRLGRHADLLPELRTLAAEHPLDERLAGQLMIAAYRSGSPAEALERYQRIRTALAEELGADPSSELRRLHEQVLRNDPELGAPAPQTARVVVPAELPPDIADFTDRDDELARVRECARSGGAPVMISGPPGIGKSALAVHAAHRLAAEFPDGQLYVDLQGATKGLDPLPPGEVLERWLHTLGGSTTRVPMDLQEAAARFRSLTAGRRLLLVLDNASTAAQVRPLLPAGPGCAVLITSRGVLGTLPGADHLRLEVLSERGAIALLGRLAGPERVTKEPEQASAVARLCGFLPLALRIAGARLAVRPHWTMNTMATRLTDERRRLDELQVAELAVRASFTVGYDDLRPEDARIFRLIGRLDGPDIGLRIAAALAGTDEPTAETVLDRLVDAQLLAVSAPERYRMHDLIRLYAREIEADDPEEALDRAFRCYLADARQASLLLHPQSTRRLSGCPGPPPSITTKADAIAWVDNERANLAAAVTRLCSAPDPTTGIRLTAALFRPFDIRGHWSDLITTHRLAIDAALRAGDRSGAAQAYEDVGYVHCHKGQFDEAISLARKAIDIWRDIGDDTGEASCLDLLGRCHAQLGEYDDAVECLENSLEISRRTKHRRGEALALNTLGLLYQRLGKLTEAISCHEAGLAIDGELGNQYGEGVALANLGWGYARSGRPGEAVALHQRSLEIARVVGDRYLEAEQLWGLGQAHQAMGRDEDAGTHWRQAIAILHEIGALTTSQAETLRAQRTPATPDIILRNT